MKSVREVRGRRALLSLVLLALILAAFALPAAAGGRPLFATLTGANEVPGPGDEDGSGYAMITLNQGLGQICYTLEVADIDPARAAHIHRGTADVAGQVVVPLAAPTEGSSSACVEVDPELIKEIRQNPADFYVNVHNAPYPAGAVRGQLEKPID